PGDCGGATPANAGWCRSPFSCVSSASFSSSRRPSRRSHRSSTPSSDLMDSRTEAVRRFYEQAPFPGYPPRDSLQALRQRAERSVFARLLDRAIPGDARIVEIGCGTGQMSLYLAHADRVVIGADLSRPSLLLGSAAARRLGVRRVTFIETDLRCAGLKAGAFDVVYCSGV